MFGWSRSVTGPRSPRSTTSQSKTGPLVSVHDWVRPGRGVLFLPYHRADRGTTCDHLRLAAARDLPDHDSRWGDQRLWFIVDELDALGPIDGLKDALARLRMGGRCVLGFQSIAQVSCTYGHGKAQTIVENCSNTLICAARPPRTAAPPRFASKLIGEREVIRPTVSRTRRGGLLRRTRSQRQPRHTARDRKCCTRSRSRTAARPCGLPQVRQPPRLAAREASLALIVSTFSVSSRKNDRIRSPRINDRTPPPGLGTPRKPFRSAADRVRSHRDRPLQSSRNIFPAKPARMRVRGSPSASELQSSVRPQSVRYGGGTCLFFSVCHTGPRRGRSVAPFGPLLRESAPVPVADPGTAPLRRGRSRSRAIRPRARRRQWERSFTPPTRTKRRAFVKPRSRN